MSFIVLLADDASNFDQFSEEISEHLAKYEALVAEAEPIFKLEGRLLEEICKTIPHYQARYDQAYHEVKALEEWINVAKERKLARLWKKYNEGYSRQLTTRDIQAYINGEKDIVDLNQLIVETTLIKNNLFAIVDAVKQMAWTMSNIVKLRVAQIQDTSL